MGSAIKRFFNRLIYLPVFVLSSILDSLLVAPPDITDEGVLAVASDEFDLHGEVRGLGGERDRNFLITTDRGQFLLKVANAAEDDQILDMQCKALLHIALHSPELPTPRLCRTRQSTDWASFKTGNGQPLRVRVFHYLAGNPIGQAADNPVLMENMGATIANLNLALRSFTHPASQHPLAWNIQACDQLKDLLPCVKDDDERALVGKTLQGFIERVKPQLPLCRHQVIHNDVCFHNTVVGVDEPTQVAGIFDFGDMVFGPLIQDLANPAAEVPAGSQDPLSHSAQIVAGFHSITPLEDREIALLPDLVAARLGICLLLESWAESTTDWEDDRNHLDGWRAMCVDMLQKIYTEPRGTFEQRMRSACGLCSKSAKKQVFDALPFESAWAKRERHIGNAHYYAYDKPLQVVRSGGVWLYDPSGKRYLDAYNNVPHAGHCHPRITAAISEQTAKLNTNTRYVYDLAAQYAERLTATLPDGLDVCYFVSSGSEANDLAWRLATNWSDQTGALVLDNAYHGVTEATYALSPAESRHSGRQFPHVGLFAAPDDYRGEWKRDDADRGERFAGYVGNAIEELGKRDHQPAAWYFDMIMSSNGVFTPPPGYLETIYPMVREAGGLCVADEVQSGFGRTGQHMWGFEFGVVAPDIVTFGKPVAGGYPMGVVVTRREIADKFVSQGDYFSTTGGNPVACAAALAMLDVIEEECLMANADRIGKKLRDGIKTLSGQFPIIGDVRGSGLFIGVEIIADNGSMSPDPEKTQQIVNGLRHNGVLIGSDGNHYNVLKIRPPMVFDASHVCYFLEQLEQVLRSL